MARSNGRQVAQGGELIEQIQDRRSLWGRGPRRPARHVLQALRDHQAQPAGIRAQAIRRQDEEHGRGAGLQIPEREIRVPQDRRHAGAIEEMGVALSGREDACRLPAILAQVPVGGAGNEPAGRRGALHARQEGGEGVRARPSGARVGS